MRKYEVIWRDANDTRGHVRVSKIKGTHASDAIRTVRRLRGDRIYVLGAHAVRSAACGSF